MAHTRLRKFNTREMYPDEFGFDVDLCMVVRAGNRVFVRGQTGLDLEGNMTGTGDVAAQTENAMTHVRLLLEEAGSKLDHICKITVYVTDRQYWEPVMAVLGRWFKGIHPCATGLQVAGLVRPEMLMEIDVEAVIPDASA